MSPSTPHINPANAIDLLCQGALSLTMSLSAKIDIQVAAIADGKPKKAP